MSFFGRPLSLGLLLLVPFALAACDDGGSGGSGGTGGGNGGNGGATGGSGGAGGDGGCGPTDCTQPLECPTSEPVDGDPCPKIGFACELDRGIILSCRARSQCTADGWLTVAPGCSSDPLADPGCPATEPTGTCDVATDPGLCTYGEGFCGCSNCLGGPCGGQAQWLCAVPPPAPCPTIAPKLGEACVEGGLECVYGDCALGGTSGGRLCSDGVWIEQIVACPE